MLVHAGIRERLPNTRAGSGGVMMVGSCGREIPKPWYFISLDSNVVVHNNKNIKKCEVITVHCTKANMYFPQGQEWFFYILPHV